MKNKFLNIDTFLEACYSTNITATEVCAWAVKNEIIFLWHPLGFVMASLMTEGKRKIRLHFWSNSYSKVQEPKWLIHDHLFDLDSWVLSGGIENIEYKIVDGLSTHQLYSVSYSSTSSLLTKTDLSLSLKTLKEERIFCDGMYRIKSGVFHQSKALSQKTTVTVCYTVDSRDSMPMVAGALSGDEVYEYFRVRVSEKELQNILKEI